MKTRQITLVEESDVPSDFHEWVQQQTRKSHRSPRYYRLDSTDIVALLSNDTLDAMPSQNPLNLSIIGCTRCFNTEDYTSPPFLALSSLAATHPSLEGKVFICQVCGRFVIRGKIAIQ